MVGLNCIFLQLYSINNIFVFVFVTTACTECPVQLPEFAVVDPVADLHMCVPAVAVPNVHRSQQNGVSRIICL